MSRASFEIGDCVIEPGTRQTIDIPLGVFSNHTPMNLPIHVLHGHQSGPVMFVSAAIHGDEVLGVEIIRRLMQTIEVSQINGTLMLVPVVNAFGFISHTRYLPDRRDLNRSFPGGSSGSFAARLANTFMTEIVLRAEIGVDLHTGSLHRSNLPQIRTDIAKGHSRELAEVFGAPIILNSNIRDGSLREAAQEVGVDVLVYEAGEALRFDEFAIRAGLKGVINLMRHKEMVSMEDELESNVTSVISNSSHWLRAPKSGIFRSLKKIGESVERDETIGIVNDPFGEDETDIVARASGIIIGQSNLPVTNQGDALIHVARVFNPEIAENRVEEHEQELAETTLLDDPNNF